MSTNKVGGDPVWWEFLDDEEPRPDPKTPLFHHLLNERVRITIAHAGDVTEDADYFDPNPPRLKRDVSIVARMLLIEAGGPVHIERDDGSFDWLPFAYEIEPAPMRWWHWRRLEWRAAAVVAVLVPVAVFVVTYALMRSADWPVATSAITSALSAAPWAWLGGVLAVEAWKRGRR